VKGSFTGASADKAGLFQAASAGTLFLDEVADLPIHMQVKLLRVIQEKTVRPIGGRTELSVDVRILSATHKDLAKLVEAGAFRQDLFYRINVIEVRVPTLRERREDVPLLAARYLDRMAPDWGIARPTLSPEALDALRGYDFPGNVRELENILERAIALCEDGVIRPGDLRLQRGGGAEPGVSSPGEAADRPSSLGAYIDSIERETILRTLQETRYNKTRAAEKLGITFRALRYKLKKLAID
jgi:two-component system response regulator PilR (NtrC family)